MVVYVNAKSGWCCVANHRKKGSEEGPDRLAWVKPVAVFNACQESAPFCRLEGGRVYSN